MDSSRVIVECIPVRKSSWLRTLLRSDVSLFLRCELSSGAGRDLNAVTGRHSTSNQKAPTSWLPFFRTADNCFDNFSIAITVGDSVPTTVDFRATFEKLKAMLKPYEKKLIVVHDTDKNYYLDTRYMMKNKQRLFFAAVRVGKAYVSFHLMPVYACPDLLNE